MAPEGVEQTRRAKFFPIRVLGLGDSIGVEHQRVTRSKLHFRNLALPGFKQSHHGAGGTQPLHLRRLGDPILRASAGTQQERGKMSTIRVTELAA